MPARLGIVIYRLGIGVAILMGALGALVLFGREPAVSVFFFFVAAIAWGIGRAALYILAGE